MFTQDLRYKDGEVTAYVLADASGIHRYFPEHAHGRLVGDDFLETETWAGREAGKPDYDFFFQVFNLEGDVNRGGEPKPSVPEGGWSLGDLSAKFNGGK